MKLLAFELATEACSVALWVDGEVHERFEVEARKNMNFKRVHPARRGSIVDSRGVVLATIPATAQGPTLGFLAHVDTAPAFAATNVKPRVHRGYNGGAISFPDAPALVLSPETMAVTQDFPDWDTLGRKAS